MQPSVALQCTCTVCNRAGWSPCASLALFFPSLKILVCKLQLSFFIPHRHFIQPSPFFLIHPPFLCLHSLLSPPTPSAPPLSQVFGTIGYLAPEYTQRGRLTFKSDVFAYGVLLLQLITGKQPTDEDVAERGLARWVGANSSVAVIDPRMSVPGEQMDEVLGAIKLGLLCTSRVAADRPSMAEVVHVLENLEDFAKGISSAAAESEKKGQ